MTLARLLDEATLRSGALVGLGWIARLQADFATAYAYFTEALTIRRELREDWMIGEALDLLGEVCQQQGVWEEARHHYQEGLTVTHAFGDKGGMARDVDAALKLIVARHGKLSGASAEAYVKALAAEKRYVRDVY